MRRIAFIFALFIIRFTAKCQTEEPPNILLIICDQLNWNHLSAEGNQFVKTPTLDSLYNNGLHFDKAYPINPTCIPSRIAMFTGQRPTKLGIHIPKPGIDVTRTDMVEYAGSQQIAVQFQAAGYKTYYGGKTHFGVTDYEFFPTDMGFEVYSTDKEYRGTDCVPKAIETLDNHSENFSDQPFFMVTSLMNPHDICYVQLKNNKFDIEAINERLSSDTEWVQKLRTSVLNTLKIPEGFIGAGGYEPIDYYLSKAPPLPENYLPQSDEPSWVSGIDEDYDGMASEFGRFRADYDSIDWLLQRYAYDRFVEVIDNEVGILLDAISQMNLQGETYVIFTTDHGDQNASHQMTGKGIMFEESVHIPLIVNHPSISKGRTDSINLVSTGLDLLPTLFDIAGITPTENYEGMSLKPIFDNESHLLNRQAIPIEFSTGMGVITKDYFYNIYYNGNYHNEQLIDIDKRPVQMVNEVRNPAYNEVLTNLRDTFVRINGQTLEFYNYPERFTKYLDIDLSGNIDPNRTPKAITLVNDQEMGMQANTILEQFIDVETTDKYFYNSFPKGIDNAAVIDIGMYLSNSNGLCLAAPGESTAAQYIYSNDNGFGNWAVRNNTQFVKADAETFGNTAFYNSSHDKLLYELFESSTPSNTIKGVKSDEIVFFKTVENNYGALLVSSFTNSSSGDVKFDMVIGKDSGTTSLNNKEMLPFLVYPNPFYDYLTFEKLPSSKLSIYDINGEKVFNNAINTSSPYTANLSSLAQGTYLLKIESEFGIYTSKVLKL